MYFKKLIICHIILLAIIFTLTCNTQYVIGQELKKIEVADSTSVPSLEWLGKGRKLLGQGKYKEALDCFNKSLSIDYLNAETYYCKGLSLCGLKRYKEAIESFDKALEIAPEFTMVLMEKGKTLYLQGKYKDAVKCYDKLLSIDSGYPYAKDEREKAYKALYGETPALPTSEADKWVEKGNELYKQGKYNDAINYYFQAYQIDNKNIRALFNTASAYYAMKNYNDALKWYELVLSSDPGNANAIIYRDKCLKELEGNKK